jgi:type 1 glutamine amidotransferase
VAKHPVTAGLPQYFTVRDELYLCPVFEDTVTPLLRSHHAFIDTNFHSAFRAITGNPGTREGWSHPEGSALVGWAKHHRASPIVYLQGGDDATALADPHYRQLVHNAIHWVASADARDWVRQRTSAEQEAHA